MQHVALASPWRSFCVLFLFPSRLMQEGTDYETEGALLQMCRFVHIYAHNNIICSYCRTMVTVLGLGQRPNGVSYQVGTARVHS
jgi:hypothetical protein